MSWSNGNEMIWREMIETIAQEIKKSVIIVEKDTIQSIFYMS